MRHVLWTGGWDSTYHVLDLVLVWHEAVQTYYVLDPGRKSAYMELAAMRRIREAVLARCPESVALFPPTVTTARGDIPADETITSGFRTLAAATGLGAQYEWLCRFAQSLGTGDIELCDEGSSKPKTYPFFCVLRYGGNVVPVSTASDFYYVLKEPPSLAAMQIFQGIRFPLLDETKGTLARKAAEGGFADLLELTWFCHDPTPDGKPCGVCTPCRQAREEGLGRRLPPLTPRSRIKLLRIQLGMFLHRRRARKALAVLLAARSTPN